MRSPNGRTSNYNPAEMAGQCTHARRNTGRTSAPSSAANGETACGVPNCTLRQVLEYSAQSTLAHGARRCRAQSRKCTERQVPATARLIRRRNHVECQTRDLPHFSTTAPKGISRNSVGGPATTPVSDCHPSTEFPAKKKGFPSASVFQ